MEWALLTDIPKSCAMCATLALRLLRKMSSNSCIIPEVITFAGLLYFSTSAKSVRPSSNSWCHFTMTGLDIACGFLHCRHFPMNLGACKRFCKQKTAISRISTKYVSSWRAIFVLRNKDCHYLNEIAYRLKPWNSIIVCVSFTLFFRNAVIFVETSLIYFWAPKI